MRNATSLAKLAADNLRDACDLLDEASQLEPLPNNVLVALIHWESVVGAVHHLLETTIEREEGEAGRGWTQSADEIVEAVHRDVQPTPEWVASMERLQRHLSSRPPTEGEVE